MVDVPGEGSVSITFNMLNFHSSLAWSGHPIGGQPLRLIIPGSCRACDSPDVVLEALRFFARVWRG